MDAILRILGRLGFLILLTANPPAASKRLDGGRETRILAITASDFTFAAPDTMTAGLTAVYLRNEGLMPHHAWLVRLDEARTLRELERELIERGALPGWAVDAGGPGVVDPGGEARVTLLLTPGRHVILSGERLPDGSTAVMRGMYHLVEVVGDAAEMPPPAADITVEMRQGGVRVGGSLPAGRQRVLVLNRSKASSELRIYRLRAGQTMGALLAWLNEESSPAPAYAVGGVVGLAPAAWAVLELALVRGEYVLIQRPPRMRHMSATVHAHVLRVR